MVVLVLITKYILWCYYHFTVWGTSFHSDNFYKTTLHICSQETSFCCFYGRIAVPPVHKRHYLANIHNSGAHKKPYLAYVHSGGVHKTTFRHCVHSRGVNILCSVKNMIHEIGKPYFSAYSYCSTVILFSFWSVNLIWNVLFWHFMSLRSIYIRVMEMDRLMHSFYSWQGMS